MSRKPPTSTLQPLVDLCHHRWVIPLLAAFGPDGRRFAVLGKRLGVAGPTVRRALDAAIDRRLVIRNPGYGHPLRPEYLLTERGARLAPASRELVAALQTAGVDPALCKWTLPVLLAIDGGATRFGGMQAVLAGATPRALARTLRELEAAGWIVKQLSEKHPPRYAYALTPSGRVLAAPARRLALDAAAPA